MSTQSLTLPPPTVFIVDDDATVLNALARGNVSGYAVQTFGPAQLLLEQHHLLLVLSHLSFGTVAALEARADDLNRLA